MIIGSLNGEKAMKDLGVRPDKIRNYFLRADTATARFNTVPRHLMDQFSKFMKEEPFELRLATILLDAVWSGHNVEQAIGDEFREEFYRSQRVSIDAFISRWPELAVPARTAVAAFLLLCENEDRLDGNWYQQLLESILRREAAFLKVGLRVISFNYDRSFLRYFWTAVRSHFHNDGKAALEFLKRIEILHVYGSLGSPFNGYGDLERAGASANEFDLAGAGRLQNVERVKEMVRTSSPITLLGFGFWPENLELLELPTKFGGDLRASAFGLPTYVRMELEARYPKIVLGSENHSVFDFIKQHNVFRF